MKHLSPICMVAGIVLATALAACGSSSTPNGSSATTGTGGSTASTSTTGTTGTTSSTTGNTNNVVGNTNSTTNANTTTTTSTATISVTGTLGSMSFTGKDAVYAADTVGGVPFVYAVLGDAANLCNAFSGSAAYDGNLVVVALITDTGSAITAGDYTIEDPNSTTTTGSTLAAATTTAVGFANVALMGSSSTSAEIDATTGDVNVTSYSANSPLVFTLTAGATGSTGAGLSGNVSAPACTALATALQSSGTSTSNTLLARARRVFVTNLK